MNSSQTFDRLDWSDLAPWTLIFRSLTTTFSVAVLVFALIGVVATPMGWIVSETIFIGSPEYLNNNPILAELVELNRSPHQGLFRATASKHDKLSLLGVDLSGPRLVFEQLIKPFYAIFGGTNSAREFLYYAFGSVWSLVVWSFAGLGIARISLLRFTRNERAGLDDAFEYAFDYFRTCCTAMLMPFGLVALLCIPMFLIGLILGFDFGVFVTGIFWFIVLGLALLLGILLLGMMVSWPLVITSVAAEGQNSFDAITRAFAYAFQRPVHYFFYAMIAIVFGGVCWLFAVQFTESVIRLSFWSTASGANLIQENRINTVKGDVSSYSDFFLKSRMLNRFQSEKIVEPVVTTDNQDGRAITKTMDPDVANLTIEPASPTENELIREPSTYLVNGRKLIEFWTGFARTIAAAFLHGLFWCMASAIYLLLRKDVDQTAMDEIFLIDERRTYDLPPLKSDEHGIPQVQPLPLDDEASR